jgi:hypothetical protein
LKGDNGMASTGERAITQAVSISAPVLLSRIQPCPSVATHDRPFNL